MNKSMILMGLDELLVDVTYNYTYGYVELPNGECVEGTVDSWTDYDDSNQIQVKIDGVTYFTDMTRVVLTTKEVKENGNESKCKVDSDCPHCGIGCRSCGNSSSYGEMYHESGENAGWTPGK